MSGLWHDCDDDDEDEDEHDDDTDDDDDDDILWPKPMKSRQARAALCM